jgi:hypothetical protein
MQTAVSPFYRMSPKWPIKPSDMASIVGILGNKKRVARIENMIHDWGQIWWQIHKISAQLEDLGRPDARSSRPFRHL